VSTEKALKLDPSLAEAHTTLASLREWDYDWTGAEREYKRGIELNPSYQTGHDWYSIFLAQMGRTAEAIAEARRAQEVDPLSPQANTFVCWQFYFAHQFDQALEQANRALELNPDYMPAYWCSGVAHEEKGDFKKAIAELQRAVTLSGGSTEILAWLGHTYAVAGEEDKAAAILERMRTLSRHEYVAPYRFAEIYTALGDKDQAFIWWGKARDEHAFPFLIYLRGWAGSDSLRSDPRYTELLHSIGLTQQAK